MTFDLPELRKSELDLDACSCLFGDIALHATVREVHLKGALSTRSVSAGLAGAREGSETSVRTVRPRRARRGRGAAS